MTVELVAVMLLISPARIPRRRSHPAAQAPREAHNSRRRLPRPTPPTPPPSRRRPNRPPALLPPDPIWPDAASPAFLGVRQTRPVTAGQLGPIGDVAPGKPGKGG